MCKLMFLTPETTVLLQLVVTRTQTPLDPATHTGTKQRFFFFKKKTTVTCIQAQA